MKMTKYALTIILLLGLLFVGCETVDAPIDNSNPQENTGDNSDDDSGDNTEDNTGDNTEDNTGDNTEDNTGDNPDDNTGDNPDDNTSDNPDDYTGDNPDDNTGDNPDDNTGDNSDDNTGDNPDDNTGDNPDDNTGDKPGTLYVMDGPFNVTDWVKYENGYRNDYISFYEADTGYAIYFDIYTDDSNTTLPTGEYLLSDGYDNCAHREWCYFTFYTDGDLYRFNDGYIKVIADTEHSSGFTYHKIVANFKMENGDSVTLEYEGTITESSFE